MSPAADAVSLDSVAGREPAQNARGRRTPPRAGDSAARAIVFVWTLAVCSPGLHHTLLPNLQWWTTLAAALTLLAVAPPRGSWVAPRGMTAAAGLTAAVFLSAMVSAEPLRAAGHALKISVVLLAVFPLLLHRPRYARAALAAMLWALAINFALISAAAVGLPLPAGPTGSGRWGTLLNRPGTLAQLGGFVFGYAAYGAAALRPVSIRWVALACAAATAVALDGSRTAFLGLGLVGALLLWLLRTESSQADGRRLFARATAALTAGGLVFGLWTGAIGSVGWAGRGVEFIAAERIRGALEIDLDASVGEYLERVDRARFRAAAHSIERIAESPLLGSGLGSTTSQGAQQQISVHNAYLQSWADLGLLGFLSYAALTLRWIPGLGDFLRRVRRLADPRVRLEYYGAACGLVFFCWWGLFQGVGVDPSAWIYFLVPITYFARLSQFDPRSAAGCAVACPPGGSGR